MPPIHLGNSTYMYYVTYDISRLRQAWDMSLLRRFRENSDSNNIIMNLEHLVNNKEYAVFVLCVKELFWCTGENMNTCAITCSRYVSSLLPRDFTEWYI